jgi:hypothetical protein
MHAPRPVLAAALLVALSAGGCHCLGPRAVLIGGEGTLAVGARTDVVLIACTRTFDWDAVVRVGVTAAIISALGRVDVLAYVPQALIPGCEPLEYTVTDATLVGDDAFTIETHPEPWLFTLRADAPGAAFFRVRIETTEDGPLEAEIPVAALVADRVDMAPACTASDAAAGSGLEARPDLLPVDTTVAFAYGLYAGNVPLGGYDFYPVDAVGLTYVGPDPAGVAYRTDAAPGPARLTSSIDADFSIDLALYERAALDALALELATDQTVYAGQPTDLRAFALAGGAVPCVDDFPRTVVSETPEICSVASAAVTGPEGIYLSTFASGLCRVTASLDGTALTDTLELYVARGFAPVALPFHGPFVARAVWGASSTDVFVAGYDGSATGPAAVAHFDGAAWTIAPTGTFGPPDGIWGSGPADVYAVGSAGSLAHFDGASWTPVETGYTVDLHGVWGSGPDDVYAVGAGTVILHWDGAAWTGAPLGFDRPLTGVWGSSADDVYIVGPATWNEPSTLVHKNLDQWIDVRPAGLGEGTALSAVWGSGPDDVWVGGEATLLHGGGGAFAVYPLGYAYGLNAFWGGAADDVYAAGTGMLHFDGFSWSPIPFDGGPVLSVWRGGSRLWVVAVGGGLYDYQR